MPSKCPKKRVTAAVDTSTSTSSGRGRGNNPTTGDMAPLEQVHQPPPALRQQPNLQYQQPQYYQQYQQPQLQYQPQQQGYYMGMPKDQELLEDFCAYLENRVLTKNMALLRRMLTEFLSRQEHTLAQFKCFGVNLVAILPFDVLDQTKRRHADLLLQKPKHALVDRTCVFEFLFARVATKNLAMLKQMFVEFRTHMESSISEFVKLGVAAVSIVPYDPPRVQAERFAYNPYAQPQPPTYQPNRFAAASSISQQQQPYHPQPQYHQPPLQSYYPPQQYVQSYQQQQQQQHFEQKQQQGNPIGAPGVTPKHERAKKIPTGHCKSHPSQDLSARSLIGSKAPGVNDTCSTTPAAGKRVSEKPVRYYKEQEEDELVAAVAKSSKRAKREQQLAHSESGSTPSPRVKARKTNTKADKTKRKRTVMGFNSTNKKMLVMDLDFSDSEEDDENELELQELQLNKSTNGTSKRTIDSMIDETLGEFEEHAEAEAKVEKCKLKLKHRELEQQRVKEETKEAARLRQQAAASLPASSDGQSASAAPIPAATASGSAGWTRLDDAALQLKTDVRDKLREYETSQPWKQAFCNLPLPFDEVQAPKVAVWLRLFWKVHARAVWERNFWMPLGQDGDSKENAARKARQRLARIMFDEITSGAFKAFGAEFFLRLDAHRHPGWWYRGPILDILALHRVVGDVRCWEFVESQLCERFPDCGLELPLKSPNYGVLRRHKCASAAMWSNVPKTAEMLGKIVALKEERRARAKLHVSNGSSGSPSPVEEVASVREEKEEEEEEEEEGSGEAGTVVRGDNGDVDSANTEVSEDKLEMGSGGEVGADDDGEGMILSFSTETDADVEGGEDNDEEGDNEEELLGEKIALAGSFGASDALQTTPVPAIAPTARSVDATAAANASDGAAAATGNAIAATVGNGANAMGGAAETSASVAGGRTLVRDRVGGAAADALARELELESARSAEFVRKINPFDGE